LNPKRILRIGTGELTDSLALDPITGLSSKLTDSITDCKNIILELKTKTNHIGHLNHQNSNRVVLSWSVNPETLVRTDEHKSAPLQLRLQAAKNAAKKGFRIGLHFDPIILIPDWENQYENLIKQISEHVLGNQIAWISLGSFRYPGQLKEVIKTRFPKTNILLGEQIIGLDGKQRYLKPIRRKIYQHIVTSLREKFGDIFIYFCMESEDIWQKVLNISPQNNQEIDWYFASHLFQKFPELGLPEPYPQIYRRPIRFPDGE
jgi:spore photoproduct lyase